MRIVILVDDYLPSTKSGAKMVHDLAKYLAAEGHEVFVVTPGCNLNRNSEISVEDGIQVVRIKAGNLKGVALPLRGWRENRLSATLWRRGKRFFQSRRADLIIFYSPTIFFGGLVRRLKSLWGCPAYLVLRDIFPKWAVEAGILRREGILHRHFRKKELLQYSVADKIGVEAHGNLKYFEEELSGQYPVEVLFSWMELGHFERSTQYRRELGLDGKVVFFYGGNIGVAQDMDNIVRLAAALREREDLFFLVVGEGSEVPRLRIEIENRGLKNLRMLPAVSQVEYKKMLSEFDVGLVTLDRRLSSHNLPGKIFGYMNNALPILASLNPGNDLTRLLRDSGAGIACENGDDQCLLQGALRLGADPRLRQEMGKRSRQLLETTFSVAGAAAQILTLERRMSRRTLHDDK